ncbi:MAG: hypothetical protein Q8N77_00405, partial [Nanoarchaeota archaeon]|nr:hypothetical protein [Nanoarchaeota archaeon]
MKNLFLLVFCILPLIPIALATIGDFEDYNNQMRFGYFGYDAADSDSGYQSRGSDYITGSFSSYDTSGRFGILKYCGNNIVDGGEECDGINLNDKTCITQGYSRGTLTCRANCSFDTSGCITDQPTPSGPSSQGGGAAAGGQKFVPPDLELSQNIVKVELKQGETKTLVLNIKNTGGSPQAVSIDLQNLKKFILVSEPSFILQPYEEKTLTFDFTASQTETSDVYMGTVTIRSEYTQKIMRVIIDVVEKKALFDTAVSIQEEFKQVMAGETLEAEVMVYNLGDLMPVDVVLNYGIKDFEGNTIAFKQETFAVEEQKKVKMNIK